MQLSFPSWTWGCVLWAAAALAGAETLPESIQRCAAEKDKEARLTCYDEVAAISAGPAPAPPSPEQQFGVKGELLRKQQEEKAKENPAPEEIQALTATVAKVKTLPRGQLVVELDNGQAWEQKDVTSKFFLKVGEQVKIESGSLGAYWLSSESGRRTRVKRVR